MYRSIRKPPTGSLLLNRWEFGTDGIINDVGEVEGYAMKLFSCPYLRSPSQKQPVSDFYARRKLTGPRRSLSAPRRHPVRTPSDPVGICQNLLKLVKTRWDPVGPRRHPVGTPSGPHQRSTDGLISPEPLRIGF